MHKNTFSPHLVSQSCFSKAFIYKEPSSKSRPQRAASAPAMTTNPPKRLLREKASSPTESTSGKRSGSIGIRFKSCLPCTGSKCKVSSSSSPPQCTASGLRETTSIHSQGLGLPSHRPQEMLTASADPAGVLCPSQEVRG